MITEQQKEEIARHMREGVLGPKEIAAAVGTDMNGYYKISKELIAKGIFSKKGKVLTYIQTHVTMDVYEMAQQLNINVDTLMELAEQELGVALKGSTTAAARLASSAMLGMERVRPKAVYDNKPISPIVEAFFKDQEANKETKPNKFASEDE